MPALVCLPEFSLEIGGSPLPEEAREALTSVRVQQRLSQPTLCELTFASKLLRAFTDLHGSSLAITMADGGQTLFRGEVTAVEYHHGPFNEETVRVRCYDALHRLRKHQPVRVFAQVTVADLARELVAGLNLSVDAAISGPLWSHYIQYRQSDLELLTELAERCGLYATVRGDVLHLITLQGIGDVISLALGESLLEAHVEVNGDPACRKVRVLGWDPARIEPHSGRAGDARVGRNVSAEAPPQRFGADGEITLAHQLTGNDSHAEGLAQAELDARVGREVVFHGTAEGDARLLPGARVSVEGLPDSLSGTYVLTEVIHKIDRSAGYTCEISSLPPVPERRRVNSMFAWGRVTNIDDPEGLGRVRVSLPTIADLETHWMEVMCPGAGNGKGLVTQPDVGDRVLVLFADEHAAQGVVLGGVYGPGRPPDDGIAGGAVRRYTLLTRGRQQLVFDDEHGSIRLQTSNGSQVELTPGKMRLHSAVDLDIEAPGRTVTIAGNRIDFRKK